MVEEELGEEKKEMRGVLQMKGESEETDTRLLKGAQVAENLRQPILGGLFMRNQA